MPKKSTMKPYREIERWGGILLNTANHTESAPAERVAELEAKHDRGERLFEPGRVPKRLGGDRGGYEF